MKHSVKWLVLAKHFLHTLFLISKGDKRKLASNRGQCENSFWNVVLCWVWWCMYTLCMYTSTGEAEASGFLWVWSQPISIKIKNKNKKVFLWSPHLHHGMCASHTHKINFKNWNMQHTINSCYQRTVVLTEHLLVLSTSILTDGYCQRDPVDRDQRGQVIFKRDGSCYRKKLLSTGQGAKEDVPKSCHLTWYWKEEWRGQCVAGNRRLPGSREATGKDSRDPVAWEEPRALCSPQIPRASCFLFLNLSFLICRRG